MYLVAVTRWGAPLEDELEPIALALGVLPYDARLRLSGAAPVVAAAGLSLPQAQQLLGFFRERGHGAVACDVRNLPTEETTLVPRSFEFHAEAFVALDEVQRRFALPYSDILGLVRAAEINEDLATVTAAGRKFSMGKAVMTGGLVRHTKTETSERRTSLSREEVCFVFRRSGPEPMLLREHRLHYDGLGDFRGRTVHESFSQLVGFLRRDAPGAIYDDRLLTLKRKPDLQAITGAIKQHTQAWSNSWSNALAAHVLILGHLQEQL